MAEISNNLLAVLLVLAILVSGFGLLNLMEIGRISVTGIAVGLTNVSITGAPAIEMVRNATDFGSSDLGGAIRTIDSQQDNFGNFTDGTEGNNTNYGDCNDVTVNCSYPFVVNNTGNVDIEINISSTNDPHEAGFLGHTSGLAWFKGKNNESGACTDYSGFGEGSWVALNNSPDDRQACGVLQFEDGQDELRIHFRLTLPSDITPGPKDNVITIQATQ